MKTRVSLKYFVTDFRCSKKIQSTEISANQDECSIYALPQYIMLYLSLAADMKPWIIYTHNSCAHDAWLHIAGTNASKIAQKFNQGA